MFGSIAWVESPGVQEGHRRGPGEGGQRLVLTDAPAYQFLVRLYVHLGTVRLRLTVPRTMPRLRSAAP